MTGDESTAAMAGHAPLQKMGVKAFENPPN